MVGGGDVENEIPVAIQVHMAMFESTPERELPADRRRKRKSKKDTWKSQCNSFGSKNADLNLKLIGDHLSCLDDEDKDVC